MIPSWAFFIWFKDDIYHIFIYIDRWLFKIIPQMAITLIHSYFQTLLKPPLLLAVAGYFCYLCRIIFDPNY